VVVLFSALGGGQGTRPGIERFYILLGGVKKKEENKAGTRSNTERGDERKVLISLLEFNHFWCWGGGHSKQGNWDKKE